MSSILEQYVQSDEDFLECVKKCVRDGTIKRLLLEGVGVAQGLNPMADREKLINAVRQLILDGITVTRDSYTRTSNKLTYSVTCSKPRWGTVKLDGVIEYYADCVYSKCDVSSRIVGGAEWFGICVDDCNLLSLKVKPNSFTLSTGVVCVSKRTKDHEVYASRLSGQVLYLS